MRLQPRQRRALLLQALDLRERSLTERHQFLHRVAVLLDVRLARQCSLDALLGFLYAAVEGDDAGFERLDLVNDLLEVVHACG